MTVRCEYDKSDSKVILTRRESIRVRSLKYGTMKRGMETVVRTRQCIKCNWRWKTIELYIRSSHRELGRKKTARYG